MIKQNIVAFTQTQKQKQLLRKVLLMKYFNQSKIPSKRFGLNYWLSCRSHHYILKYNPLAGSISIKLPKELDHPKKGLINNHNFYNQTFKWGLILRIGKVDRMFERKLGFKDKTFPVKIRDIHKIEKKNCINIGIFVSRNTFKKHLELLLLEEKDKRHYILIKDFNTFMYNHTLRCGRLLVLKKY